MNNIEPGALVLVVPSAHYAGDLQEMIGESFKVGFLVDEAAAALTAASVGVQWCGCPCWTQGNGPVVHPECTLMRIDGEAEGDERVEGLDREVTAHA